MTVTPQIITYPQVTSMEPRGYSASTPDVAEADAGVFEDAFSEEFE